MQNKKTNLLGHQKDAELYNNTTKYLRCKKPNIQKRDDLKDLAKALSILEKFFSVKIGAKDIKKITDIPSDMIDKYPQNYYDGLVAIDTINQLIEDIKTGKNDTPFYSPLRGALKADLKKPS